MKRKGKEKKKEKEKEKEKHHSVFFPSSRLMTSSRDSRASEIFPSSQCPGVIVKNGQMTMRVVVILILTMIMIMILTAIMTVIMILTAIKIL